MFKRVLVTGLALCLPLTLASVLPQTQAEVGTLRGQVTDAETGYILRGVQVVVHKASLGGLTNGSGRFLLRQIPLGRSTLVLEHPCFHSVAVEIDLSVRISERILNIGMPFDLETGNRTGCDMRMRDH